MMPFLTASNARHNPIIQPTAIAPVSRLADGKKRKWFTTCGSMITLLTPEPITPTSVANQHIGSGITQSSRSIAEAATNAANKAM